MSDFLIMYRNDVGEIYAGSSSLRSSQHSVLRVLRTVYCISVQYHHLFLGYTVTTSTPIRHVVLRQGRVTGTQKPQSQGKGKGKGGGSSTIRCRCGFLPKCVGKNLSPPTHRWTGHSKSIYHQIFGCPN